MSEETLNLIFVKKFVTRKDKRQLSEEWAIEYPAEIVCLNTPENLDEIAEEITTLLIAEIEKSKA